MNNASNKSRFSYFWSAETRHKMRWAIFHVALVIFLCDLISVFFPAFDKVWTHVAHLCVAGATVLASVAEWIAGIEESEVDRLIKEHSEKLNEATKPAEEPTGISG